jgi:hypothetical protein
VLRMGLGGLNRRDFRQVAGPLLEKLTRETQEARPPGNSRGDWGNCCGLIPQPPTGWY